MGDMYTNPPQSRNEAILRATIDGTEYTDPPQSRIEDLLIELKEAIEEGGGSVESYEQLTNKPQINGTTLSGNKTTEDLIPIGDGLNINADGELETADAYIPTSEKGTASGVATLTEAGKVPEAQLPSYVDDAIEGYLYEGHFYADSAHTEEITGERGKIYVDLDTNRAYRWTGSTFVEIGDNNTFTANRALVSDANGKVSASSATSEEVGYLSGVTGAIQTQLDGKQNTLTFDSTPTAQSTNPVTSGGIKTYVDTQIENAHIYGVEWDGSSTSKWTRTDASRYFAEPQPAINNGNGYSPFDNVFPWAGMVVIDDTVAGSLVSIPKFWYKWTRNGSAMKLQIADAPVDGFHVSPAHMDRGDGTGERDVVYIGRHHCADDYTSKTGVLPLVNKTRDEFRNGIHALGSNIWQNDFAMFWTIRMLYLVEFADWNSQKKIGYGCGDGSALGNMGYTDNMKYHTGTTQANRTTYGLGTQYRGIEGLWDNAMDWIDGIRFSGNDIYCIKNPSDFSDTDNGINIGTRSNTLIGVVKTWTNPQANGFEYALFPSTIQADSSYSTYSCDYYGYNENGISMRSGGSYSKQQFLGMFCIDGANIASTKSTDIGSRLMVLP